MNLVVLLLRLLMLACCVMQLRRLKRTRQLPQQRPAAAMFRAALLSHPSFHLLLCLWLLPLTQLLPLLLQRRRLPSVASLARRQVSSQLRLQQRLRLHLENLPLWANHTTLLLSLH